MCFPSRQKRKLDEMYDQLRNEYESVKRSAIQPANNYFPRAQPDLFSGMPNIMDSSDPLRQGNLWHYARSCSVSSTEYFGFLEASSPQKQLIHLLQDRLILLKPQGAEKRGGLHNQGNVVRTLVLLSCLVGLLVTLQHLRWIWDPDSRHGPCLELTWTILQQLWEIW